MDHVKGAGGRAGCESLGAVQSDQELDQMDLRRGPWTGEEDVTLINYIIHHGEGRWNSLARCAGLKRTGKSCRLRWLNYLRPDVRRGNITLEEQLLILELHSRWGNRWSKIAQHLPGRTDNEIKNYWRTRVQKHAKQLKCDVNSKQFQDTMRYLWMPRLVERIQAAAAAGGASSATSTTTATAAYRFNNYDNTDISSSGQAPVLPPATMNDDNNNNNFGSVQVSNPTWFAAEKSSAAAASTDSFSTQVSPVSDLTTDCYNYPVNQNPNQDYYQCQAAANSQFGYSESLTSPCGYFNHGLDFQAMDQSQTDNHWMMDGGDFLGNLWNVDDNWLSQPQVDTNI